MHETSRFTSSCICLTQFKHVLVVLGYRFAFLQFLRFLLACQEADSPSGLIWTEKRVWQQAILLPSELLMLIGPLFEVSNDSTYRVNAMNWSPSSSENVLFHLTVNWVLNYTPSGKKVPDQQIDATC